MTLPDAMVHPSVVVAGIEGSLDRMHCSIAFSRYLPNSIVECSGCADDQSRLQTHAFRIASGVIDTRTFANMQDDEGYAIHLRIRVLFAMYIIDVR